MNDEHFDVDAPGLARARWVRVVHAIGDALEDFDCEDYPFFSLNLEAELGLRPVIYSADLSYRPKPPVEWARLLSEYEREHEEVLCLVVPKLERALAAKPERWLRYVREMGCACFDPVELSACAAVARLYAHGLPPKTFSEINALLRWCWDCLLGVRPIPWVSQAPERGDHTLILDIINAVSRVELNWRSLALSPVINDQLVVRWDQFERWTAWVRLVRGRSGEIAPNAVLRIRSDNTWRLVRPAP